MGSSLVRGNEDLVLVGGIIGILLILFAPIPPVVLDFCIILNFAFALTILLLTFYVDKPVRFSTFPSLLLVATLFRLALNVAATRLILTGADAGEVIGSIGAFAVQGNIVIGLVIFFILIVVQYVVVTAGAQRVSEVAARFVLDSVPGQQMSIDSDLNMGLIDQNEAKRRRRELEKEASFYGAMDGASKFVKGDAIASVIILLTNIIAGLIIGVVQMDMSWGQSLRTFALLTIGDGIVTQVPALIISVGTGIVVTRSSADRRLSTEVFAQLSSVPRVPLIVLAALVLLLVLPGMPKWPILIIMLLMGAAYLVARRRRSDAETGLLEEVPSDGDRPAVGPPAPIEIRLGRALADHWRAQKPMLAERIGALRAEREQGYGFILPAVSFQDGPQLGPNSYEILVHGSRHGLGELHPDLLMAVRTRTDGETLPGIEGRDPAFGLPAVWIAAELEERARTTGYALIDPTTILVTHLGEIARSEAAMMLSRAEVVALLEGVRTRQPGLVEELVPAVLTVSDVQRVLQGLLAEHVSIRNIDAIVEGLVDSGRTIKQPADLIEVVRERLCHGICHALRGDQDQLAVLSLDPRTESQLVEAVRRGGELGTFAIEPRLAEQLIRKLIPLVEAMIKESVTPVLLCGPELRRHLRSFVRRSVPRLAVLSVNEIPATVDLRSFAVLRAD